MTAAPTELTQARARIAELENIVASLREALTPSGSTKFAYIGEFKFTAYDADEQEVTVPWSTVKHIMKAISDRANSSIPGTRAALAGEKREGGE